jgi:hypothetical protein
MDEFQNSPMVKHRTMTNIRNMIEAMDLEMVYVTLSLLESRMEMLQVENADKALEVRKEWLEKVGKEMDEELRRDAVRKARERDRWNRQ